MNVIPNIVEFKPLTVNTTSIKCLGLGSTLELAIGQYKDVVNECQQLQVKYMDLYKDFQENLIERASCKSCLDLKEIIVSKENIINSVASQLTLLNETKNFLILDEIFRLLCGDTVTLTPKDSPKNEHKKEEIKFSTPITSKDESVSEIEGTPTGRTSPIIQPRNLRNKTMGKDEAGKKKCSSSWSTPEAKHPKLTLSSQSSLSLKSRSGKLRQTRIIVSRPKETNFVDLTCSPLTSENESVVKKEPVDSDETIMPSPTSGPVKPELNKFKLVYPSPSKLKKATELVKLKTEISDSPTKCDFSDAADMENSINLFNPNRYKNSPAKFKKPIEVKMKKEKKSSDAENANPDNGDETRVEESINLLNPYKPEPLSETFTQPEVNALSDTNASLSILRRIDQIEQQGKAAGNYPNSPSKRPLAENRNAQNVPEPCDTQASVSVLGPRGSKEKAGSVAKRKTPEKVEPVYKEPTVRKKAEKRALPGWSCEECKNFYSELYADNHEMLLKLMNECSRHRGLRDPARAATPPGFWPPRWSVPADTEAFNARNDA